jgi:uncharacterized protein (TIRG00374 family)
VHSHRRRILLIALAAAAVLAIAVAISRLHGQFRWDVFLSTFRDVHPGWIIVSTLLSLATYVVRGLRWRIMLRPLKPHPHVWSIISATCIGFTAITLFGRPGELVRPYLIAVREKVSFSSQLAAWFLERIYDLLMVLVIFGCALTRLPADRGPLGPALEWVLRTGGYVAAGIGALCVAILIAASQFSDVTRSRLIAALSFLPDKLHHKADGLVSAFTSGVSCSRKGSQVAMLLLWSVIEWLLVIGALHTLFLSIGVTAGFSWIDSMVFLGFVAFGSIVQIPGIGGGMQVVGAIILNRLFGIGLEQATGISILFWVLSFVVIVPIGLLLAFHEGVKLKSLRHIGDQAPAPETIATEP